MDLGYSRQLKSDIEEAPFNSVQFPDSSQLLKYLSLWIKKKTELQLLHSNNLPYNPQTEIRNYTRVLDDSRVGLIEFLSIRCQISHIKLCTCDASVEMIFKSCFYS